MVSFDERVIQEFADSLYSRADGIVAGYTIVGMLIGLVGGTILGGGGMLVLGAIIAGGIGYAIGLQKAFLLKLQAQLALCQVQIERNTRATVNSPAPAG